MRKKLNWKETAFLAASALVLAVSGAQVFRRDWDAVPVGRFQFVVAKSEFTRLPSPSALLSSQIRCQPLSLGITRDRLAPIHATVHIGHEGSRPSWWGKHADSVWVQLSIVNGQGKGYYALLGKSAMKFDTVRQQYVMTGEFAVPATPAFIQRGHFIINLRMNRPLGSIDLSDTQAPILSHPFVERFKVAMPKGLQQS